MTTTKKLSKKAQKELWDKRNAALNMLEYAENQVCKADNEADLATAKAYWEVVKKEIARISELLS